MKNGSGKKKKDFNSPLTKERSSTVCGNVPQHITLAGTPPKKQSLSPRVIRSPRPTISTNERHQILGDNFVGHLLTNFNLGSSKERITFKSSEEEERLKALERQKEKANDEVNKLLQELERKTKEVNALKSELEEQKNLKTSPSHSPLHNAANPVSPTNNENKDSSTGPWAWEIDPDTDPVECTHELGRGGSAIVYKGKWRGGLVAVKKLLASGKKWSMRFQKEINIMMKVRHPNITLFMGASLKPFNSFVLMEFASKGNLHDVIEQENCDWFTRLSFARDICSGLNYLHHNKPDPILHRDLKSTNILIFENYTAKLCDFGLATERSGSVLNATTVKWMPPEMIMQSSYTTASDVYALGLILWEIVTGEYPYKDLSVTVFIKGLQSNTLNPLPWPETVNQDYRNLVEKCWKFQAEERPPVEDVLCCVENIRELEKADRIRQREESLLEHSDGVNSNSSGGLNILKANSIDNIHDPNHSLKNFMVNDKRNNSTSSIPAPKKGHSRSSSMTFLEKKNSISSKSSIKNLVESETNSSVANVRGMSTDLIDYPPKRTKKSTKKTIGGSHITTKSGIKHKQPTTDPLVSKPEKEKLEKEKIEKEKLEKEKIEKEKLEKEKLENEKIEKEKIEKEKLETVEKADKVVVEEGKDDSNDEDADREDVALPESKIESKEEKTRQQKIRAKLKMLYGDSDDEGDGEFVDDSESVSRNSTNASSASDDTDNDELILLDSDSDGGWETDDEDKNDSKKKKNNLDVDGGKLS